MGVLEPLRGGDALVEQIEMPLVPTGGRVEAQGHRREKVLVFRPGVGQRRFHPRAKAAIAGLQDTVEPDGRVADASDVGDWSTVFGRLQQRRGAHDAFARKDP